MRNEERYSVIMAEVLIANGVENVTPGSFYMRHDGGRAFMWGADKEGKNEFTMSLYVEDGKIKNVITGVNYNATMQLKAFQKERFKSANARTEAAGKAKWGDEEWERRKSEWK